MVLLLSKPCLSPQLAIVLRILFSDNFKELWSWRNNSSGEALTHTHTHTLRSWQEVGDLSYLFDEGKSFFP